MKLYAETNDELSLLYDLEKLATSKGKSLDDEIRLAIEAHIVKFKAEQEEK